MQPLDNRHQVLMKVTFLLPTLLECADLYHMRIDTQMLQMKTAEEVMIRNARCSHMHTPSEANHTCLRVANRALTPPVPKYKGGRVRPLTSTSTMYCHPKEGVCFLTAFTSDSGMGWTAYMVRSAHTGMHLIRAVLPVEVVQQAVQRSEVPCGSQATQQTSL